MATLAPPGLESAFFESHGHRLLGGLYVAAGARPRPTVILLHGIPGLERSLDLAYALREAGVNCLWFHYRGCWGSAGAYSLPGLADDVRAAAAWARQHPAVDGERLALAGLSLGGYLALTVGAADPGFKAIVALSPLVDPQAAPLTPEVFRDFAAPLTGVTGPELQAQWQALPPIAALAAGLAGRPVLVVTADQDALFPPAHYQHFPGAFPAVAWRRFAEADHVYNACRRPLVEAVTSWLAAQLGPA